MQENADKQTQYKSEKADNLKYSEAKLPWFSCLLQHSVRKRGVLILQRRRAHTQCIDVLCADVQRGRDDDQLAGVLRQLLSRHSPVHHEPAVQLAARRQALSARVSHQLTSKKIKVAHTRLPSAAFRSRSRLLAVSLRAT